MRNLRESTLSELSRAYKGIDYRVRSISESISRKKIVYSTAAIIYGLSSLVSPTNLEANSLSPICGKRSNFLSKLKKQYSEVPVANGLATNGGILEVLASSQGNSWTIMVTMPNGTTCLIAAGENWEDIPKKLARDGPKI